MVASVCNDASSSELTHGVVGWRPSTSSSTNATQSPSS